jgi:hypothetical protein
LGQLIVQAQAVRAAGQVTDLSAETAVPLEK